MPRIEPIDPGTAEGRTAELLDAVRQRLGMIPNLPRTMAQSPATLAGYLGFSRALSEGSLSPREREQIALHVAQRNACSYCLAAHAALGKLIGLSELDVLDARRGSATGKREDAIVKFAGEVVSHRGSVPDDALHRVRAAGVNEGEITEVVAHVALNVFTNYLNQVAQTEIDFPAASGLESRSV